MSAVLACILGAVAGVAVGLGGARFGLPIALRSQKAAAEAGRLRAPFGDPVQLERITRLVYRYLVPLVFGGVGGVIGYSIWAGRAAG
ncbi:hypothetical protein ACFSCV_03175 [Methylopila henanensis]|uniref:Uncharacterized protein n=1 Tax=Methylopila henanensis TaxID=873516 RepID=A0ABW4K4Z4_9HYPH